MAHVTATLLLLSTLSVSFVASDVDVERLPPPFTKTVGQPWPMPQVYLPTPDVLAVSRHQFNFQVAGATCDILQAAFDRYFRLIFYAGRGGPLSAGRGGPLPAGRGGPRAARDTATEGLRSLMVDLSKPCEVFPSLYMDESYNLTIKAGSGVLRSASVWGVLRGLETFSQLVWENSAGQFVNSTTIRDFPRFPWRGAMLDTARHFLPKDVIFEHLDAMAYNKLNAFHWHIVDDQSFPYQSGVFPKLSEKGTFYPYSHIYSQGDIKEIIEFARMRGIRVMPEFDSPGHARAWGRGQPGLLTECGGKLSGTLGPMDPTKNATYAFMHDLLQEVASVFPDKFLHLGGDEVSFACWESNPAIKAFMQKMGFGTNYKRLQSYYTSELHNTLASIGRKFMVWQEVADNKAKISSDTIVNVWKYRTLPGELERVTKLGFTTILSANWYLSKIQMGQDWPRFYLNDPHKFNGTAKQKQLVIGGELCMWGEFMDATNVIASIWPRGSAVAERLWSSQTLTDVRAATRRMEEQRCRMIRRGVSAEPVNGPGACRLEYDPHYSSPY